MLPKGAQNAKRPFSVWNYTSLEKVCYKVSSCDYCQRQSCKAFTGLSVSKWFAGDVICCVKIWPKLTHPLEKRRFSIDFARSASVVSNKWRWCLRMVAANLSAFGWFGLRVGGHPALSLHSSDEPGELSQWLCHDDSTINIVSNIILLLLLLLAKKVQLSLIGSPLRAFQWA